MKNQKEIDNNQKNGGGGVNWYRKKIVEMIENIESEKYLRMIYGYVRSAYREEKSRG